ncbi:MAG: flagellar protein FlaG [Mobilitalea sp.]
MSLEGISGAVYQDKVKPVVKPRVESNSVQEVSQPTINVTEIPGATKVTAGNQSGKDQLGDRANEQKEGSVSEKQLKDALSKANNRFKDQRTRCEFTYHEETKRVSIKVYDSDTKEIIREIPPEKAIEMVEKMWELAGMLVDEKR